MIYCTACSLTDQKSLFGINNLGYSNRDDAAYLGIPLVSFFDSYNVVV